MSTKLPQAGQVEPPAAARDREAQNHPPTTRWLIGSAKCSERLCRWGIATFCRYAETRDVARNLPFWEVWHIFFGVRFGRQQYRPKLETLFVRQVFNVDDCSRLLGSIWTGPPSGPECRPWPSCARCSPR